MWTDKPLVRTARWVVIYTLLILGMWWLHDPRAVSMDAAKSTVKFVYQQF